MRVIANSHWIAGGGGVRLHVAVTGRSDGRSILFVHGFSQSHLIWRKQLQSDLASEFRLIALDLRGHGLSERPAVHAYADPQLWADDIRAVIEQFGGERPLVCAWSYGTAVVGDYLRLYGEDAIGGFVFVGGLPGPDEVTPAWGRIQPGLLSEDATECTSALAELVLHLVHRVLMPEEFYLLLGWNAAVPPAVRRALLERPATPLPLPRLSRLVWLLHGSEDQLVLPASKERVRLLCPGAHRSYYPDAGHALFWDQPDRFNAELASIARSV